MANFSNEAQEIYDAADYHNSGNDSTELIVAAALRAVALQLCFNWNTLECIDHLFSIANEMDPLS